MPRKPKSDTTDTPSIIRPQIAAMAGVSSVEQLEDELPESTAIPVNEKPRGPNGRTLRADGTERAAKRSRNATVQQTGLMDDPEYRKAIQGMNFFGAPRIVKRGFSTVADVAGDDSIKLTSEEEKYVDQYFYAVSKHVMFDPMEHIAGRIILFVLLMGELILTRIAKRAGIGEWLKQLTSKQDDGVEIHSSDQEHVL